MNFVLVTFGSAGDVHPMIGLGRALRSRGHAVTVITNPYFEEPIRAGGLPFAPAGAREQYEELAANPDLWHPRRGFKLVCEAWCSMLEPTYDAVVEAAAGGDAVVAATGVAFGARVAREHLGLPLATVHLQPACLRSLEETPVIAGLPFPGRAPRFLKRALYRVVDWFADRELAGPLNAFRARLGLSPCARILGDWWNSPDLILALFPEWFARPQPDWPRQTVATEFPLYDESATLPPCDELERFLAAGEPPIAFTPGSATQGAERFFAAAAGACARLGRRGLLITRYAHQVPASLPEGVRHVAYVPFSRMLPHVAAFVHHGGIGTTAQAFAAAVPQLIVPMSFDQPDNARRVAALGAGRWLPPARVSAGTLARELRILLEDTEVTRQARELAERIPGGARLEQASTVLESWAAGARAVPFAANR